MNPFCFICDKLKIFYVLCELLEDTRPIGTKFMYSTIYLTCGYNIEYG